MYAIQSVISNKAGKTLHTYLVDNPFEAYRWWTAINPDQIKKFETIEEAEEVLKEINEPRLSIVPYNQAIFQAGILNN